MTGPEETEGGRKREELLHLYADGLLDRYPDELDRAESAISTDPEARRLVEDIRSINDAIRQAAPFRPDVPPRLRKAFKPQARPALPRIGHTAAAIAAALAMGFFAGHLVGASTRAALPEETVAALARQAPDRGRMAADAAMAGVQAARTGREVSRLEMGKGLPDFSGAGFVLSEVGRRTTADRQSMVEARYENAASGDVIELSVIAVPRAPVAAQQMQGEDDGFFWSDGYLAYGLKARKGNPDLGALADLASNGGSWALTASGPAAGLEASPGNIPLPAAEALMPSSNVPVLPGKGKAGNGSGDPRGS